MACTHGGAPAAAPGSPQQLPTRCPRSPRPARRRSRSPSAAAADKVSGEAAADGSFDLALFGRHTHYGNGMRRPLMRGWVHTAFFFSGLVVVRAACTHTCDTLSDCAPQFLGCDTSLPGDAATIADYPPQVASLIVSLRHRGATGLLFAQWCLVGYVGSVIFHMVPFTTPRSVDIGAILNSIFCHLSAFPG